MNVTIAKCDTIFVSSLSQYKKISELGLSKIADLGQGWLPHPSTEVDYIPFTSNISIKSRHSYWLLISLHNDLDDSVSLTLKGTPDYFSLFKSQNNQMTNIGNAGFLHPSKTLAVYYARSLIPFKLSPGETSNFYIWFYERHRNPVESSFFLSKENGMLFQEYKSQINTLIYTLLFLGAFCFLSLFVLFMYYKSRHRVYLYYTLYLVGAVLYSLTRLSNITLLGNWLNNYPLWRVLCNEPTQFLFFAAYNFFIIELLDIKNQNKALAKTLRLLALFYIIYALIFVVYHYISFNQEIRETSFYIHRSILFPINIFLIIWCAFTIKSPVLKYFLVGVSSFMLASLLAVFSVAFLRKIDTEYIKAINIFQLGLMTEALCFAFALGYKIKVNEDEKNENRNALIRQLETNRIITEQANLALEGKVKQRTEELIAANQKIAEQEAAEVKAYFSQKLSQAETMALRSQMNPHFLFNSLNSIKYLIQSQQNQLAIKYLTRFSKLVRMVLEHSRTELVSLKAELDALKLYLEIESDRLGDQFTYQITAARNIQTSQIEMPPMLLQPFVENAIWHGLLNSNKLQKKLSICISKDSNKNATLCTISDNGIGRAKAEALKKNTHKNRQSLGLTLILERISLFNQQYTNKIEVVVEDIVKNGEIDGTRVLIYFYDNIDNNSHIS